MGGVRGTNKRNLHAQDVVHLVSIAYLQSTNKKWPAMSPSPDAAEMSNSPHKLTPPSAKEEELVFLRVHGSRQKPAD